MSLDCPRRLLPLRRLLLCSLLVLSAATLAQPAALEAELEAELEAIGEEYVKHPKQAWDRLQAIRTAAENADNREHWADWNLLAALVESTMGDLNEALAYAETGVRVYEELDSREGRVDAMLVRGNIHGYLGRYRKAITDYEFVLGNSEGVEDAKEYVGSAWIGLGDAYAVIGDFAQALEALTEAYAIFRELGDEEAISSIFGLLGNIYSDIDAAEEAIKMYKEATELDRRRGDDLNVAINLYNIGRARTDLGQTELARDSYREALAISRRVGSEVTSGYIQYGIGLSHLEDGNIEQAREHFHDGEQILRNANDDFQLALTQFQLARLDLMDGQAQRAVDRARSAVGTLRAADDEKHLIQVYALLSRAHAELEEYQRAFEYGQLRNELMDKFASEERARRVAQLRVRLDTDRAEDEARALTLENQLKAELLERERFYNRLISYGAIVLLLVLAALILSYGKQKRLEARLRHLANTDDLTGLLSRRHLFQLAEREMDRADRYDVPLSIMVLDLDFFKSINDRYGHATGDDVLRKIAENIDHRMRDSDHLGRVGGEEFLALLPHTGRDKAIEVADRLVKAVSEMSLDDVGVDERLTISIGVACYQGAGDSFSQMIRRADAALYEAKADGRNQARAEWMVG